MMTSWQEVKLGDISVNYDRKRIPLSAMERIERKGQYKYYGAQGVIDYIDNYIFDGTYLLVAEDGENLKSNKQNIAQLASGKFWVNNHAHILQSNDLSDIKYLLYYLNSTDLSGYITGSAQPKLSQANLNRILISLPPVDVQKKIAGVLGALDDKIELNNKINNNLEQQAQALFKSWFVNFEPFGGTMPEDWKEQDIYSIANIIYGAPFASKLFNTEKRGKPIIRIRDLKNQYSDTYTEEVHPKAYIIRAGDIVVGMDGEFRPYIWGNDEGLLNQRVCVFENKRPMGKMFLYLTIKPLLNRVEQTEVATTVIHIGKQDFDAFKFNMPVSVILDKFDKITNPIYDKIVSNSLENTRLAAIRDALLPKLMSGEIDVSNVDISALTSTDKLSFTEE